MVTPTRVPPVLLALMVVIGASAAALTYLAKDGTAIGVGFAFPVLIAIFAVGDSIRFDLHLAGEAHSIGIFEMAIVVALCTATPLEGIAASLIAVTALRATLNRSSLVKTTFNIAVTAVDVALAYLIFGAVRGGRTTGPFIWVGACAAVIVTCFVSSVMVMLAIRICTREPVWEVMRQTTVPAMLASISTASMTLAVYTTWMSEPQATALFAIPAFTLVLAYRALAAERETRRQAEFLAQSSNELQRARGLDDAVWILAGACQRVLKSAHVEIAMVVTAGDDRDLDAWNTWLLDVGAGGESTSKLYARADEESAGHLREHALECSVPVVVVAGDPARAIGRHLGCLAPLPALVAPLFDDGKVFGLVIVAGRTVGTTTYTKRDLELISGIAAHSSAVLAAQRLEQALTEVTNLHTKMSYQANHDPLTDLPNRRLFHQWLGDLDESSRIRAVALIDLDDFKGLNDTLGHDAGDHLLRVVADRLCSSIGREDAVARLGGDEFAIIFADDGAVFEVISACDRVTQAIERDILIRGRVVNVGVSIGVAEAIDGVPATELLRNADVAMYDAKRLGKRAVSVFAPEMGRRAERDYALAIDLRGAVERDLLEIAFQPAIDLSTGETVFVEALARWQHPTLGTIPPSEFVPAAERLGLIDQLGRGVLHRACAAATLWPDMTPIAVNVSPLQFGRDDFVTTVGEVLDGAGLAADRLILEITESAPISSRNAADHLRALRAMGVRVALDDFGSGYAAPALLSEFAFDLLKLDRSLIKKLPNHRDSTVVGAIIEMGAGLGMKVVAEGIETEAQHAELRRLGCVIGQGYRFARPLDGDALGGWFAARKSVTVHTVELPALFEHVAVY